MYSTRTLTRWDKKYVWHPFTQMRDWRKDKITIIKEARDSHLVDTDGQRYLDGVSSLWCNVHGHRVTEIDRAISQQLKRVAHSTFLGLSNIPAILLSKRLVDITPRGLNKVFYSDSGSEAVEIALKIAFQYWRLKGCKNKIRFVRFHNAYHGDTVECSDLFCLKPLRWTHPTVTGMISKVQMGPTSRCVQTALNGS